MDAGFLATVAETLRVTGPWGIVVVLGWFYWRTSSAKDKEIRELYTQMAELTGRQTQAIIGVRNAIIELRETVVYALLRAKNSKPPKNIEKSDVINNV